MGDGQIEQDRAKGLNQNGGAEMVIREAHGSRGGMFSVSSITFGGSLLIDTSASRITSNVIHRALGSRRYKKSA